MSEFSDKVQRKRELIQKHQEQLKNLLNKCPHDDIERKSHYHPGTYYDKAYTDYWNECKVCGKRSEVTTIEHSYYG